MSKAGKFLKNKISRVSPRLKELFLRYYLWLPVVSFILLFSAWLMCSTFGYSDGTIYIKTKLYSDFLSHLSLIRSFSMGDNFPPEYPHFPGVPIRYHFLFYALVGLLEKSGLRLDIALNSLSIIGMSGLLLAVFFLAKKYTKSFWASFGAMLVVICNTSFSWIYYFLIGKNVLHSFGDLFSTNTLAAFGPYNDTIISAFWNLNIYTNQRHLAFAFALMFLCLFLVVYQKNKKSLIIAILGMVVLSWLHKAVLMTYLSTLLVFIFCFPKKRGRVLLTLVLGTVLSLPGLIFLGQNSVAGSHLFIFQPGFLYQSTTWWETTPQDDFMKWLIYWILNAGILPILAVGGFISQVIKAAEAGKQRGNKLQKIYRMFFNPDTAWFWAGTGIFVAANLFNFGLDMANNHKLVNYAIYCWAVYAFIAIKNIDQTLSWLGRFTILPVIFLLLFFGGFCDFFPIYNDNVNTITDYQLSDKSQWVLQNSQPKDVFLNLGSDYNFVTLTGRKIYLGVAYFNWSLGYDEDARVAEIRTLINQKFPQDKFCAYLKEKNISFVYFDESESEIIDMPFDSQNLLAIYGQGEVFGSGFHMYKTVDMCR